VVRSGHVSRRAQAAAALGAFGPAAESAVPVLIQALRDDPVKKDEDRYFYGSSAARALGRIAPGTRSAADALSALIEVLDPRSDVHLGTRLGAIEALPAFGASDPRVVLRLRAWRENSDPHLKTAAGIALARIEESGAMKGKGDRQSGR